MPDPSATRPFPTPTSSPIPNPGHYPDADPGSNPEPNPKSSPGPGPEPEPRANLAPIPVIGFVAPSGTGKTTLIRQLVPLLRQRGLGVGYLKHSHHQVEVDRPGKDSFELREAGASQVLLATGERWIMQSVQRQPGPDPELAGMLALFDPRLVDLILVEGFKFSAYPKLEVHRAALAKPYLYPGDPTILALISDASPPTGAHPPLLPLGDSGAIVDYLLSLLYQAGDQGDLSAVR